MEAAPGDIAGNQQPPRQPDESVDVRRRLATLAEQVADEMAIVGQVDWKQVRAWVDEMARLTDGDLA